MLQHGPVDAPQPTQLRPAERFWRNRLFARLRHQLTWFRRSTGALTRGHATLIHWTGGRVRRSFVFTGGMPILVLTTVGRKTGKRRSTPLAFLRWGDAFAVMASNAGSDHIPGWWLNLLAEPTAEILADRTRYHVTARQAEPQEDKAVWDMVASLNPGFDEYRQLTERKIPIIFLEPQREQTHHDL